MTAMGPPKRMILVVNEDSVSGQIFSSVPDAANLKYGMNEILQSLAYFAADLKKGVKEDRGIRFASLHESSKQQQLLLSELHGCEVNIINILIFNLLSLIGYYFLIIKHLFCAELKY
jgi:hypothetical protein